MALYVSFSSPRATNILANSAHRPRLLHRQQELRHAVEVGATTLYEAAVLAMAGVRRCGFTASATRTRNTAHGEGASAVYITRDAVGEDRGVASGRAGKPNEQAIKGRMRELLPV